MMSLLGKEKEVTSRSTPHPTNEILKAERKQTKK
jgi:hypothetical protein